MKVWRCVSLFLSVLALLAALYTTPLLGNKPAVIVSGSMEPTIQTGAFILVHFSDFEDCELGDVITYYHPGLDELVTHRIVERGDACYWTKGDANPARDGVSVVKDNFYGKVTYVANWLAPFMRNWIVDRRFDKEAFMSVLLEVGLGCWIACIVISFISSYIYSLLFGRESSGT